MYLPPSLPPSLPIPAPPKRQPERVRRTAPLALTETIVGGVELSLPHQSLGNTYIELISEVMKDLPGVTRLDLRDNRLTDVGVQDIVEAICTMDSNRGIQVTGRFFSFSISFIIMALLSRSLPVEPQIRDHIAGVSLPPHSVRFVP